MGCWAVGPSSSFWVAVAIIVQSWLAGAPSLLANGEQHLGSRLILSAAAKLGGGVCCGGAAAGAAPSAAGAQGLLALQKIETRARPGASAGCIGR